MHTIEELRSELYLYLNATFPGLNIENEYKYMAGRGLKSVCRRLKALWKMQVIHEIHWTHYA